MDNNSLKGKTFKGLSWSLIDNIANQGITFIVGLVLARLLTPEEYGIIGIILIFIAIFNGIVDGGLSTALIQKSSPSNVDYNTVFYSNLVLSIVMYVILYLISEPIAAFFSQPILISITKIMGVILIINALSIIHRTILVIRIDFKTQTKISLTASVLSGVLGISSAIYGLGVWSLVIQQLSRQLLSTILLWIWCHWRPSRIFSKHSFVSLFGYGWKIMLSGMINSLWTEIYQIIIGRYYSAASLGQYTRAKQFSDICSSNLTSVVQRVTFPVLVTIKDDQPRLKSAYRKLIRCIMLVTCVLLIGMAGCSESLILLLLGNQWTEASSYLPIICFAGVFYPLSAINLNMLMLQGKSGLYLKLEIIKKCIALVPIIVGIFFNIYYMLWASVIYGIVAYIINAYFSGREINYNIKEQIADIRMPIILSGMMYILIRVVNIPSLSPILNLLIQVVVGALFVIIFLIITKDSDFRDICCTIHKYLRNAKS